jgi:hypothetical protein
VRAEGRGRVATGVFDGVAVRYESAPMPLATEASEGRNGDWTIVTVRASRDHRAILGESAATPADGAEPYREGAMLGRGPQLGRDEADALGRVTLAALTKEWIRLERRDGVVEVGVRGPPVDEALASRAIDVACALVDETSPRAARPLAAEGKGFLDELPGAIGGSILVAIMPAFLASVMLVCFSDTVRNWFAPICGNDEIALTVTRDDDGTGYTVECRTKDGQTYGCFPIWAASFDVFFPGTMLVAFGAFAVRGITRRRGRA